VRQPGKQDRCAAELERAAAGAEPYHQGLAMTVIFRQALIAIAVAVIVVAIADFVLWETATESEPSEAPNAEMVR
jgi:hypothetical protein